MAIKYVLNNDLDDLLKDEFVIVDFFSTTCGPCKVFSRILEDVEAELPFVNIVKVNITDFPGLKEKYEIQAFPTIHFYKYGELVKSNIGVMQMSEVKEIISRYMY